MTHDIIKDKRVISLPRYINQPKSKFLIFGEVYKKTVDPYRGEELQANGEMVKYLSGGLALKDRPVFSVQYHPEASPGPRDSHYLFRRFADLMGAKKRA